MYQNNFIIAIQILEIFIVFLVIVIFIAKKCSYPVQFDIIFNKNYISYIIYNRLSLICLKLTENFTYGKISDLINVFILLMLTR